MKKSIYLLLTLFAFLEGQSQMSITRHNGTPITNGQIISFSSTVFAQAKLDFYILNSSSSQIKVRVKCESITNSNGQGMELCIGPVCLASVQAGNSYPNSPVVIPANGQNSNFEHFYNSNPGDGVNYPMDYVFKFYQVNDSGVEVGNSVTFTYRFNPNLAIDDFTQLENSGIVLNSSLIQSQLDIRATKNNTMQLFDLNGKLIKTATLSIGEHAIDTSNLISGMYILKFRNEEEGQESSIKIMKN